MMVENTLASQATILQKSDEAKMGVVISVNHIFIELSRNMGEMHLDMKFYLKI